MNIQFPELEQRLNSIESLLLELTTNLSQPKPEPRRIPVDIDRAAEITHLAKPTLYGRVAAKTIPHFKQGKKLLFFEDDLIAWIREGKRKTLTEIEAEAETHLNRRRSSPLN